MVVVYVDTNVIIARYKPNDPLYKVADKFFQKNYDFVVSPVTLVELYSVLARIKPFLRFSKGLESVNLDTLIAFIIYDLKLKLVARSFMSSFQIFGERFRIPLEYHLAMRFAEKLRLKTLDALHIVYAYILRDSLDYIVTGDDDILSAREMIKQYIGLEIRNPSELL